MHSSPMKSALNERYFVDDLGSEKPTRLEQMRKNSKENIDNLGVANDPAYENLEKKSRPARRSSEGYLSLILFACFIAIAALLLSLLLIWGKLGKKCECSRTEALSTSVEKLTTDVGKLSSLEEKITSLQRDSTEKGNELKRARSSLDYLQDENRNLSAKLNITESLLQKRDSHLASLLMEVRHNITAQLNLTESQLQTKDNDLSSLLMEVRNNFTKQLNITESQLQKKDSDLASSVAEVRYNITAQTKAWLETIRNDANSTRNQLMATDADTKVALDAVNMTNRIKLNNLDAALYQLANQLNRTNVALEEVNSTIQEADIQLGSLRNDLDQSKIQLIASDNETRKSLEAVNASFVNKLEKFDTSVNQLKSTLNRTNSDLVELNETLRKYPCCSNPCKNGGTCYLGKKKCTFICACAPGFVGELCEKAAESCKEINDDNENKDFPVSNQSFPLKLGSDSISVYCHVTRLGPCGAGGWTLVMKMNGSKDTFHYDSEIWSNKTGFDVSAGMTGLDEQETKLPTYWKTSFTKICLGMKNGEEVNFILISKTADSLHSLIADGEYRNTSIGRDAWKSLLGSNGSLQLNCNKEGFNAHTTSSGRPKARIGILGNKQNDCNSSDSRIGFGTGPDSNTCGNVAAREADNGDRNIKAMGYILVQ